MTDYRINAIALHFFINLTIPLYPLLKNKNFLKQSVFSYAASAITPLFFLLYVLYKRNRYRKIFLRKMYVPSKTLFIILQIIQSPIFIYYYYVEKSYIIGAIHFLISIFTFLYIYWKDRRTRVRINSFDNTFKLGIIAFAIGETNGLRKNEVVKIVKTNAEGYIVKNSKGAEFKIEKEAISEIIDVV